MINPEISVKLICVEMVKIHAWLAISVAWQAIKNNHELRQFHEKKFKLWKFIRVISYNTSIWYSMGFSLYLGNAGTVMRDI